MNKVRLATIIDCEGYVNIEQVFDKTMSKNYPRPAIRVSQKVKWYVERFKKTFGFGSVMPLKKKECWQYAACNIQALIVCLLLKDEFELKKAKALKIIRFYEDKLLSNDNRKRNILITKMKHYNFEYKNGEWIYDSESIGN